MSNKQNQAIGEGELFRLLLKKPKNLENSKAYA